MGRGRLGLPSFMEMSVLRPARRGQMAGQSLFSAEQTNKPCRLLTWIQLSIGQASYILTIPKTQNSRGGRTSTNDTARGNVDRVNDSMQRERETTHDSRLRVQATHSPVVSRPPNPNLTKSKSSRVSCMGFARVRDRFVNWPLGRNEQMSGPHRFSPLIRRTNRGRSSIGPSTLREDARAAASAFSMRG